MQVVTSSSKKRFVHKQSLLAYSLLLPSVAIIAMFMFWPFLYTIYLSFFDWNMISLTKDFVGLQNYIDVLKDPITYKVLLNTALYIFILLVFNFTISYIFAYVLNFVVGKMKGFYKSAFFLPSFISLVVGSILFTWLLNPVSGPVAIVMGWIGFSMPIWSKSEGWIIVVITLITSWKIFGYNFILLYASINGISREIIEAARLDNVPLWKIFFHIVGPMSSATGIYVFIITIVQGLQFSFTPIKIIAQGGPNYASSNAIYHAYHEAFVLYRTGHSAALSILTMAIFVVLLIVEFKYVERGIYYENK
ncbi:sugar ABC transporter permease [Lysinibacillus sphaericus]|uniref:ABC transporter permease n=2 Tax=Lysinibacillus TaxID=400634 RepID=A0A2S0K1U6_LYSSH|nr:MULTISPECIES: sugar ABC transporter permease [Lysinibacillus]AVK97308.1 ABC transporter permease [Lysinibacillus sphaericus]MED4542612.1 sugar ABC transporter permease [Lysinibacillus sphaericus]TKI20004.1 sugar ABC transporter permease [Lysinibacillus sphaericus]TKI47682.1 sugar ABC transporter permease [Lysinibacillus tabacifolii]SUV16798.1 glycerol-3-phosphate ABC transporter permease [Lysinibacillus sphaericus]